MRKLIANCRDFIGGVGAGPMPLCLKSRHVTMMVHANKIAA